MPKITKLNGPTLEGQVAAPPEAPSPPEPAAKPAKTPATKKKL